MTRPSSSARASPAGGPVATAIGGRRAERHTTGPGVLQRGADPASAPAADTRADRLAPENRASPASVGFRSDRHRAPARAEQTQPAGGAELPSQYVPASVEAPLYERWLERGYFTADAESDKPPFTIVIPPPNVTGSLHIGHAFEHTLMDALTRRARMQGFETLWLPGMDHASIAVHALVERALAEEGTNRQELGREAFSSGSGAGRSSTAAPSWPRCAG